MATTDWIMAKMWMSIEAGNEFVWQGNSANSATLPTGDQPAWTSRYYSIGTRGLQMFIQYNAEAALHRAPYVAVDCVNCDDGVLCTYSPVEFCDVLTLSRSLSPFTASTC